MSIYSPDHEPNIPDEEPPEEFQTGLKKPLNGKGKEMGMEPEESLDSGATREGGFGASTEEMEAEVLFQIAHYSDEYGGPASAADVAFEVQEKDTEVHKAMEEAVKKGMPKVKPVIESLIQQGLIMETEFGGYITTPEGDEMVETTNVQSDLGNTYESKKHRGDPSDDGSKGYDVDKDESGVPFLTM